MQIFMACSQIKTFIMLINGLRNGIDLLSDLQRADHGVLALYKVVEIPSLSCLCEFIHTFEERIRNEFPCGQVKYAMVSHLH
jgi:DNA mismatch repair protein MSH6